MRRGIGVAERKNAHGRSYLKPEMNVKVLAAMQEEDIMAIRTTVAFRGALGRKYGPATAIAGLLALGWAAAAAPQKFEISAVQKSDTVPGAGTLTSPGQYFITITLRTDDPRFSFTRQANPSEDELTHLCGTLDDGKGWSIRASGAETTFSISGEQHLAACTFSVPKAVVTGLRFTPIGHAPININP